MIIRETEGLTFDDVLLVPRRSPVLSRSGVNTGTRLSRNITLAIPIISANMDTVTEAAMAIAMARAGGLGAIHRFMPIERQAAEVARVKRAESHVVESPAQIGPQATVAEARALAGLAQGLLCHVNIIPLNPTRGYAGAAATRDRAAAFKAELERHRIPCTIRVRRGIDIDAGCGQLAIQDIEGRSA